MWTYTNRKLKGDPIATHQVGELTESSLRIYSLPKIEVPLRPIVSSLARIILLQTVQVYNIPDIPPPLAGQNNSRVQDSR